jgi:very-short-patch-repair endonuclease
MKNGIHSDRLLNNYRKSLRNNLTPQEVKIWNYLKGKRLGAKFERQHSVGPYIADFYCSKKKLIIEIDGSQHELNKEYDEERTRYLEMQGYRILRFWNNEVDSNVVSVISKIQECLAKQ